MSIRLLYAWPSRQQPQAGEVVDLTIALKDSKVAIKMDVIWLIERGIRRLLNVKDGCCLVYREL